MSKLIKYKICDIETDEVIQEVGPMRQGTNSEKCFNGLCRKVDFNRFYIDEEEIEE